MKNEFIVGKCKECKQHVNLQKIKDYDLKNSFCSIKCHKKFIKNTMYPELNEKNTDNLSNEIEKVYTLLSISRKELSMKIEDCFKKDNEIENRIRTLEFKNEVNDNNLLNICKKIEKIESALKRLDISNYLDFSKDEPQ